MAELISCNGLGTMVWIGAFYIVEMLVEFMCLADCEKASLSSG